MDVTWLHCLAQCTSTNTWALAHAAQLQHGDVVYTPRQTAGRGQHGRVWYSPPGVLTMSAMLHRVPTASLPGLSLATGLAVIYAVEDLMPACKGLLRLKWPNDVWIEQRKLAGILCEATSAASSPLAQVVVGIGINRQVDFAAELDEESLLSGTAISGAAMLNVSAISLHQVHVDVPDVRSLLTRVRHYLLQVADMFARTDPAHGGLTPLLPDLRRRDALLGQPITVEQGDTVWSGQAAGIDAHGRLLIQQGDRPIAITTGRIRLSH
ncbi:MAG: biotin--[acetyl-CoA-carboxylase] ligase [Kaiparowitsia implicata GSE-PSE-MK54-09C]|nr:biotin--[acetyl-CoA-carboxylase] ligase [Kaiparowitsia implicata GSE-PSE-MK54-09C]